MIRPAIRCICALALAAMLGACGNGGGSSSPQAPTIPPAAIEAALHAAETYLTQQQLPEAETVAAELVKKAPGDWRSHELLGRVLYLRGYTTTTGGEDARKEMYRRAYDEYRAAVERNPDSAGLHHSTAMMAKAAGNDAAALAHVQQAERLDPKNPQYPLHEAQFLVAAGRINDAKAAIARVLAIDPSEPLALATLASIALQQGEHDRAIALIEQARHSDPASVPLRVQEAKIRRRVGQPQRALELLVGLNETARSQEAVALEIAAAYGDMGEHAKAAQACERCLRVNPKCWRAAATAGQEHLAAGDRAAAATWCEAAELIAPQEAEVKELRRKLREG